MGSWYIIWGCLRAALSGRSVLVWGCMGWDYLLLRRNFWLRFVFQFGVWARHRHIGLAMRSAGAFRLHLSRDGSWCIYSNRMQRNANAITYSTLAQAFLAFPLCSISH